MTASFYLTCGRCELCAGGRETLCTDWRRLRRLHIDGALAEAVVLPGHQPGPGARRGRARRGGHRRRRHRHALPRLRRTGAAAARPDGGGDRRRRGSGCAHGRHGPGLRRPGRGDRARRRQREASGRHAASTSSGAPATTRTGPAPWCGALGGRSTSASTRWRSSSTLADGARLVGRAGTVIVVGFQPGSTLDLDPRAAHPRRGRDHRVSRYATRAEIARTLDLVAQRRVEPVIGARFPLATSPRPTGSCRTTTSSAGSSSTSRRNAETRRSAPVKVRIAIGLGAGRRGRGHVHRRRERSGAAGLRLAVDLRRPHGAGPGPAGRAGHRRPARPVAQARHHLAAARAQPAPAGQGPRQPRRVHAGAPAAHVRPRPGPRTRTRRHRCADPERAAVIEHALPRLRRWWAGEPVDGITLAPARFRTRSRCGSADSRPRRCRCGRLADGWLGSLCSPAQAAAAKTTIDDAAAAVDRRVDPEHFGVSIGYAHRQPDDRQLAVIAARNRTADLRVLLPVGHAAVRDLLEEFIAVGMSKFVLRPPAPSDVRTTRRPGTTSSPVSPTRLRTSRPNGGCRARLCQARRW